MDYFALIGFNIVSLFVTGTRYKLRVVAFYTDTLSSTSRASRAVKTMSLEEEEARVKPPTSEPVIQHIIQTGEGTVEIMWRYNGINKIDSFMVQVRTGAKTCTTATLMRVCNVNEF